MKKNRLLALLVGVLLPLSGCTLFNDEDLKYENHYNPPTTSNPDAIKVNGVEGVKTSYVEDTMMFGDVYYGNDDDKVINTYKTGGVNANGLNVNENKDYDANYDRNVYDLYVPDAAKKDEKQTVLLFIHGGAWVSGQKKDMNQYVLEYAGKGYITATMNYTLLSAGSLLSDGEASRDRSVFRDLDEIDACIASIKASLVSLGYDATKLDLVIGGGSSGSHLTMLYTYSRGDKCPLPIKFIMNAVGPVSIKPDAWKQFKDETNEALDGQLTKASIDEQAALSNIEELTISMTSWKWNEYQTMRIANGMCGFPGTPEQIASSTNEDKKNIITPNDQTRAMTDANGGEDQLSIPYWLNKNALADKAKVPMVCAYAGMDRVVGINQYATLSTALIAAGYTEGTNYKYVYFRNSGHTEINADKDATAYNQLINYLDAWLTADSI